MNISDNEKPSDGQLKKFISDNSLQPEEGKILIIREGEAPKQLDAIKPNKVHISGVISSPREFYSKRKQLHNKDKCHILYDVLKGCIILVVDENYSNDNYQITGTLEKNSELEKFRINTGHHFEPKQLLDVLKFNRIYFANTADNAKICLALQNFKAKVNTALENSNDLRGDKLNNLHSKIEHDLQESFVLDITIFKGQPKTQFKVDICVELRAGEVYVYLESVQLKDLQMSQSDGILKEELKSFGDIVCIEQ